MEKRTSQRRDEPQPEIVTRTGPFTLVNQAEKVLAGRVKAPEINKKPPED